MWGAAAGTAVALYALPIVVVGVLSTVGASRWDVLLLADLAVLALVAWRRWSPLVVLGLAALVFVSLFVVWFAEVVMLDSCGDAQGASIAKGVGAGALALAIGTWGVHGGRRAFWALPAGLAVAGIWIAAVAHAWPGGAGACLN